MYTNQKKNILFAVMIAYGAESKLINVALKFDNRKTIHNLKQLIYPGIF